MYVCLSKAMYGKLKAALMYYRKLSKYLKEYGFIINQYHPCVKKVDKRRKTHRGMARQRHESVAQK